METLCVKKIKWKWQFYYPSRNEQYSNNPHVFFWIDVSPNVKKFYMNLKMKILPQFCIIILIIFGVVLNWCVTCLCIFHFETIIIAIVIVSFKMNQDLIAWRDMAGRNWITTILSHHGWCTWTPIINGQGVIAEKNGCLFLSFSS